MISYGERWDGMLGFTLGLGYLKGSAFSLWLGWWDEGHSPSNGFSRHSSAYACVDAMMLIGWMSMGNC